MTHRQEATYESADMKEQQYIFFKKYKNVYILTVDGILILIIKNESKLIKNLIFTKQYH